MTLNQWIRATPLLAMLALCLALSFGLFQPSTHPDDAQLVGKKVFLVNMPIIGQKTRQFSMHDMQGKVAVINVFSSWSKACEAEHAALMNLARAQKVSIYGIAWKDDPARVVEWLKQLGNPYQLIANDTLGISEKSLAATSLPETYIFDKEGTIAYHTTTPLTDAMVNNEILPLVEKLNQTASGLPGTRQVP